jgi:tRNA-specific 2-thiouridylase
MKIALGLSGGVDSAVAAHLLKQAGHDVTAVYMQNWHDASVTLHADCAWEDEWEIAQVVARKLGIPYKKIDLSAKYRERVVNYMFDEYEKGRTPNPDVLCNREIKFDEFLKETESLGVDKVATGHYCRVEELVKDDGSTVYRLLEGVDRNKDQSYFLCQLSQEQLSKAIFPIGNMTKTDVRRIALEQKMANAEAKDSQGLCFVGQVDLPVFLKQKLAEKTGDTIKILPEFYEKSLKGFDSDDYKSLAMPYRYSPDDGKKIGTHFGAHFFTIGQRKGLRIGGQVEPLFVIGIDIETNTLYVGEGMQHPGLFRKALFIRRDEVHWVRRDLALIDNESIACDVRIRYRQPLQTAKIIMQKEGLYIIFDTPQRGITPGQFAAWYINGEVIGSGVINA